MKKATNKRVQLFIVGLGAAMLALFAVGPAAAQDGGPSVTIDPASVDAPGEATFTITGDGWESAPPIFVLPCTVPDSGDLADLGADDCDTGNLETATPEDGSFELEVTFDIPEEGLAIVASNTDQTENAGAIITVGDGGDDGADGGDDGADGGDDGADGGDDGADGGDDGADGEDPLADTGVETSVIVLIGLSVLAAGAMVASFSRKFGWLR